MLYVGDNDIISRIDILARDVYTGDNPAAAASL